MTTLFYDGFQESTMTTYEDPALSVYLRSDGHYWRVEATVYGKEIDYIDLDKVRGSTLEKIIAKMGECDIMMSMDSVDLETYEPCLRYVSLKQYLIESLETVKGLDYVFGPENPANWIMEW